MVLLNTGSSLPLKVEYSVSPFRKARSAFHVTISGKMEKLGDVKIALCDGCELPLKQAKPTAASSITFSFIRKDFVLTTNLYDIHRRYDDL